MRGTPILAALFILFGEACRRPGFNDAAPRNPEPPCGTSGALAQVEHTACYGSCPVYTVTLCRDGTTVYDGVVFVKWKGRHFSYLWPEKFARLARLIEGAASGLTPIEEPLNPDGAKVRVVQIGDDGTKRWLALTQPDGRRLDAVIEQATGVVVWVGTQAERDQLEKASR